MAFLRGCVMAGTRYPVSDDLYNGIKRKMRELRRQLRDPRGSWINPGRFDELLQLATEHRLVFAGSRVVLLSKAITPSTDLVSASAYSINYFELSRAFAILSGKSWLKCVGDVSMLTRNELYSSGLDPLYCPALIEFLEGSGIGLAPFNANHSSQRDRESR